VTQLRRAERRRGWRSSSADPAAAWAMSRFERLQALTWHVPWALNSRTGRCCAAACHRDVDWPCAVQNRGLCQVVVKFGFTTSAPSRMRAASDGLTVLTGVRPIWPEINRAKGVRGLITTATHRAIVATVRMILGSMLDDINAMATR